jgi:hypothetical protein
MRKWLIDITARRRITRSRQKHTRMKVNDWYDFVPAFVGTFGALSISRLLGLKGAQGAFDAGRPTAQTSISISVWSFDGTPKALQVLAAQLVAPPTPRSVVAYVPAVTSVGEALRLLDLPDEDYGWIQITLLPDGDYVIFAERKSQGKACPFDRD